MSIRVIFLGFVLVSILIDTVVPSGVLQTFLRAFLMPFALYQVLRIARPESHYGLQDLLVWVMMSLGITALIVLIKLGI